MAWLLENAPHLDIPSRRAQVIYRNLLAFVYRFADDSYSGEESRELSQLLGLISDEKSSAALKMIPDDEMLHDKAFTDVLLAAIVECRNSYLGSFTISANKDMELSSADATAAFKKHILDILLGTAEVEKGRICCTSCGIAAGALLVL